MKKERNAGMQVRFLWWYTNAAELDSIKIPEVLGNCLEAFTKGGTNYADGEQLRSCV